MGKLVGFNSLPVNIREQLDKVVKIWQENVGNNLVGVYLHGSIVLNAFNPESGDLDILVVVNESLDIDTKLSIVKELIEIDGKPCPLEMSAVRLRDLQPWINPGNCVFHYSDYWTERYQNRFANPAEEVYVVDHEFPDPDVTSYIRLINQCGIVLYGQKIVDVFSEISDEDFWAAISAEVDDYNFRDYAPRYFASNILILGRILSYKVVKRILSKYEAGLWMIDYVPSELRYLPEYAMKIWFEGEEEDAASFKEEDLDKLREFLVSEINR